MIIISPAKKQHDEVLQPAQTRPRFLEKTQVLLDGLSSLDEPSLAQELNLSANLASINHHRFGVLKQQGFSDESAVPACYLYAGDVYKQADFRTLSSEDVEFAQQELRIISAFYGLLRPLDGIWPYRLEMTAKPRGLSQSLADYWKADLTQTVQQDLGSKDWVINLASQEYAQALDQSTFKQWVDIVFQDKDKQGHYRVIAVKAKRMRGLMLRYLIRNRVEELEAITHFSEQGYVFNESVSSPSRLVFQA